MCCEYTREYTFVSTEKIRKEVSKMYINKRGERKRRKEKLHKKKRCKRDKKRK